ncbi:MAG: hypothetical protein Kow00102_03620 [Spirochaetota bacterium]
MMVHCKSNYRKMFYLKIINGSPGKRDTNNKRGSDNSCLFDGRSVIAERGGMQLKVVLVSGKDDMDKAG